MTTDTDKRAAEVAKGLTEAQKRALGRARHWEGYGPYNPPGLYLSADRRILRALCGHRIVRDYLNSNQRLTPFGKAVLAHLQETSR